MKRIHKALTLFSLAMLVFVSGCGHPRILESIEMQPTNATVSGPGASFTQTSRQFNAIGHFINPRETENITDRVTWASDTPDISTVSQTGLVTTAGLGACGTSLITATATRDLVGTGTSHAIVVGTATNTVSDSTNPACGGTTPSPVLVVSVTDAGGSVSGAISGTPTTISGCTNAGGANCLATVASGSTVTLTTTAPATFGANCSVIDSTHCSVLVNTNLDVTVTF